MRGEASVANPDRRVGGDWTTLPKDYVLYAIKYKNPWDANYLRRGIDQVSGTGGNVTHKYHEKYVEDDLVCSASTKSLNQVTISLDALNSDSTKTPFSMILTFDGNGKCSIANPSSASYTLSGTGEYVKEGDMWGGEKRDVLHLQYNLDLGTATHSYTDTLVLRDRAEKFEVFSPAVGN